MGYSSDILEDWIEILRRVRTEGKLSKNSGGIVFEPIDCFYAQVKFNRGMKAIREAALDGTYDVVIRMRYDERVNRNCYVYHDGVMYMVVDCKRHERDNIIQMKAVEVQDKRIIANT